MGKNNKQEVYDYRYALDYGLCEGPVDSVNAIWAKDKRLFCGAALGREDVCINLPELYGGDTAEGGVEGTIEVYPGTTDQESSDYLADRMGFNKRPGDAGYDLTKDVAQAPGYRGLAHLFFRASGTKRGGFKWGTNNPYLPGVKASVTRIPRGLDDRYAVIAPLDVVLAKGQTPQAQPISNFAPVSKIISTDPAQFERIALKPYFRAGQGYFQNHAFYFKDSPDFVRIASQGRVGQCDIEYQRNGFMRLFTSIIDQSGEPVGAGMFSPAQIDTGLAQVRCDNVLGMITTEGAYFPEMAQNNLEFVYTIYINFHGETSEGEVGARLGYTSQALLGAGRGPLQFSAPVPRGTRFIQFAMGMAPTYLWNTVIPISRNTYMIAPSIEVEHCKPNDVIEGLPDANPAHIVYELLVDEGERDSNAFASQIDIDQLKATSKTLFDEGFGISFKTDTTIDRQSILREIADHVKGAIFVHPQTGLWNFRLFRDDYNVASIATLTQSDCKIIKGSRRAWSECVSEMTVEYTDPATEKPASVTAFNDRGAAIVGSRIAEKRNFKFIRNSALAQIVANREINEASYPLWTGTISVSRKYSNLVPGSVFKLNYVDSDFNILNMVVRVTGFESAEVTDRELRLNVVEDIFAVSKTRYLKPQEIIVGSNESKPISTAAPEYFFPFTLPRPLLERYGLLDEIKEEGNHYQCPLFGSVQYRIDGMQVYVRNFETHLQTLEYEVSSSQVTTITTSMLFEAESRIQQGLLEGILGTDAVPGTLLMITPNVRYSDSAWSPDLEKQFELIELMTFDAESGTWSVKRGVYDTVPRAWEAGSLLWNPASAMAGAQFLPETPDADANPYPYWGMTRSGDMLTPLSRMWKVRFSETVRNEKPHRPANIKVNGVGPEPLIDLNPNSTVTTLTVTWSSRNAAFEEASAPWWTDGNAAAPEGESYVVIVRDVDDPSVILHQSSPITDYLTYDMPVNVVAPRGIAYIEVWSVDVNGNWSMTAASNYVQIDKITLEYQGWGHQWGRNWNKE